MKRLVRWLVLVLLLAAVAIVSAPVALAQTPFTLEVLDPGGATEVTLTHAPRLTDLAGKTICEAAHVELWEAKRTFPVVREMLQKQYPTAKIIPYTEFPDTYGDLAALTKKAKEKGCQAFIVGNAG